MDYYHPYNFGDYYDPYVYGFGEGTWILGGHWYADPFSLCSDLVVDRYVEDVLYGVDYLDVSGGQQGMYLFYAAISSGDVQPVPEPCSLVLVVSLVVCYLLGVFPR
jgi:hypothetical protein